MAQKEKKWCIDARNISVCVWGGRDRERQWEEDPKRRTRGIVQWVVVTEGKRETCNRSPILKGKCVQGRDRDI